MNYRQTIKHVAKKLPHRTQQDVKEVIDLMIDEWIVALVDGDTVKIADFGTLSINIQKVNANGIVRQQTGEPIQRVYGRFRLARHVKEKINES